MEIQKPSRPGPVQGFWQQWLRRPQGVWLRKALFQIHLWTGIGLGLYVVLISVSGSAIVFRNEIFKALGDSPRNVTPQPQRLTGDQLREIAHRDYPGYGITFLFESKRPDQATEIWLEKGSSKQQRLFNPYSGEDMGRSVPLGISIVAWFSDFHTNLLAGPTGRIVNGVGSIFLTLLCATGAALWWPGLSKWRYSLIFNPKANWKRINWELHSVIGFWTFALVFMWAVTGIYLVFPEPFQKAVNRVAPLEFYKPPEAELKTPVPNPVFVLVDEPAIFLPPPPTKGPGGPGRRRRFIPHYSKGDTFLRWIYYLHFGNFAGNKTKAVWVALGLLPVTLFITGFIMWWNRVLRHRSNA
ncbi:MAG TPA: PepSY-associated TM helix domain-containing protein [Bryobacteraceae bacterium]|jgi:uncharacterized iron-regulated membrane protein